MNPVEDISLLIASFLASLFGQGGGVLYTPLQIWNGINFNNAASTMLPSKVVIGVATQLARLVCACEAAPKVNARAVVLASISFLRFIIFSKGVIE